MDDFTCPPGEALVGMLVYRVFCPCGSLKVLLLVLKDLATTFHHSGGNHLNDGTTNLRGINGQE
jgi:hypothetical protein